MISRNSLGFQEILIWWGNYKGICHVGTMVISEIFLEFLERSTPRNRSNRYHLAPEMEVPKKIENRDRFLCFSRSQVNYCSKLIFSRGGFSKIQLFPFFHISQNVTPVHPCRRGADFPSPAGFREGAAPIKIGTRWRFPKSCKKWKWNSSHFGHVFRESAVNFY